MNPAIRHSLASDSARLWLMGDATATVSSADAWTIVYDGYDAAQEGLRESLCTVGNGYLATRGCASEARADGVHYPGTYAAGVFNRLIDEMQGRVVDNESLVNLPNWLAVTFRIDGEEWFAIDTAAALLQYRREPRPRLRVVRARVPLP